MRLCNIWLPLDIYDHMLGLITNCMAALNTPRSANAILAMCRNTSEKSCIFSFHWQMDQLQVDPKVIILSIINTEVSGVLYITWFPCILAEYDLNDRRGLTFFQCTFNTKLLTYTLFNDLLLATPAGKLYGRNKWFIWVFTCPIFSL